MTPRSYASLVLISVIAMCFGCTDSGNRNPQDEPLAETQCANSLDDDGDGLIDCLDPDCGGEPCSSRDGAFCGQLQCGGGERITECDDGLDNDADGVADCDDLDCSSTCACGSCEEICGNGLDDDGDGDADFGCPCDFANISAGVCANGTLGRAGACNRPPGYQSFELACDGLDNDCDGAVDEGCACMFDGRSEGVCGLATLDRRAVCTRPALYQSPELECDGRDNDCDGEVDQGCQLCDFGGLTQGVCKFGRPDSRMSECFAPSSHQRVEVSCDGLDNDCDGEIDEDCPCFFGGNSFGVCLLGRLEDGMCTRPARIEDVETSCDGLDNDCDGVIDEDCPLCLFQQRLAGVCAYGNLITGDDGQTVCAPPINYELSESTCGDGRDNDCDSLVDARDPDCAPPEDCVNGVDDDLDGLVDCDDTQCSTASECGRLAFVTRGTHDGDLGGLSFADFACATEARAAGLTGTFKAVLALDDAGIDERVELEGPVFGANTRGLPLISDGLDLIDPAKPEGAFGRDAFGAPIYDFNINEVLIDTVIWTGASPLGAPGAGTCDAWSQWSPESIGVLGAVDQRSPQMRVCPCEQIMSLDEGACDRPARLLCLSGQRAEDCESLGDQDGDGVQDDMDPDCALGAELCEDGIDNDLDGFIDCDDPDCASSRCSHTMFVVLRQGLLDVDDDTDNRCSRAAASEDLRGTFKAVTLPDYYDAPGGSTAQADAAAAARLDALELRGPVRAHGIARRVVATRKSELAANLDPIVRGDGAYDAARRPVPRTLPRDSSPSPEVRTIRLMCVGGQVDPRL